MKKSLFLAMAAVALLAGCSKDDGGIISNGGNENEGGDNENTPVQIQLGTDLVTSNTTQTRTAITQWNNTTVGILGLAKNPTGIGSWDISTQNATCALPNVEGTIASGNTQAAIAFTGGPYYYPLDNSINYSFYGYHPYVATAETGNTIAATNDVVTVNYNNFNGSQDILWGCVKATSKQGTADTGTTYDGFNARYFRKTDAKNTTPDITFNHQLVQLKFYIIKGEEDVTDLHVSSIKVINMPSAVTMTVADKNTEANEGKIAITAGTNEYMLSIGNGTNPAAAIDVATATTAQLMGDCIMLPAEAAVDGKFKAKVQLTLPNSNTMESEITIAPPTTGVTPAFTAGYSYNINLTINGLKEIEVTATLAEWKDGGSSDIEIN